MPEAIRVDSKTSEAALESYADKFDIDLIVDSQELMPHLVTEIVQSLEDSDVDWDDELLSLVVDAIPTEFQRKLEEEDMDSEVEGLAKKLLDGKGFDSEELEGSTPPDNVIYADFDQPRPTGSAMD